MNLQLNLNDYEAMKSCLKSVKEYLESIEKKGGGNTISIDNLGLAYRPVCDFLEQWGSLRNRVFKVREDVDSLATDIITAFDNLDSEIKKSLTKKPDNGEKQESVSALDQYIASLPAFRAGSSSRRAFGYGGNVGVGGGVSSGGW